MRYYYKYENKRLSVWVNDLVKTVDVTDLDTKKTVEEVQVYDEPEKGSYFLWKGQKIYMNDFTFISVDKVYQQNYYFDDDLCHTILKEGIKEIVVEMPINVHRYCSRKVQEELVYRPYMFVEDSMHKITDCYKIHLVPVYEGDYHKYSHDYTYISDLASLIHSGAYKIRRSTEKEKKAIEARMLLNEDRKRFNDDDSNIGYWDQEEAIERFSLKEAIYE